jgi:hypothetical protein
MLHNQPVPAFRALTVDTDVKAVVVPVAQVSVVQAVLAPALQIETPVFEISPPLEAPSPQALLGCLLC